MKSVYESVELEVIKFEAEDIIRTSDPMANGGSNGNGGTNVPF